MEHPCPSRAQHHQVPYGDRRHDNGRMRHTISPDMPGLTVPKGPNSSRSFRSRFRSKHSMIQDTGWWRPYHTLDAVEVFAIDLSAHADREATALCLLDDRETVRYGSFLVEDARRRFLLSRGALRLLLGSKLDCPATKLSYVAVSHGKPQAVVDGAPVPLSFNVSHSGDHGLIALTTACGIGVDLEQRRHQVDLDGVAARVFGNCERRALSRLTGPAKLALFYRLWTCKEALVKAKGTGFRYDPTRFEVPREIIAGARTALFGFPEDDTPRWLLTDLGSDGFAAALAYERRTQL